jgi:hypothetical protein
MKVVAMLLFDGKFPSEMADFDYAYSVQLAFRVVVYCHRLFVGRMLEIILRKWNCSSFQSNIVHV